MLIKNIKFKYGKTLFQLEFSSNITVLLGNSGLGKTYLGNALATYSTYLNNTNDFSGCTFIDDSIKNKFYIQYFNYKTKNLFNQLQEQEFTLVVIDNCDVILDEETIHWINVDTKNQYLLFARNTNGLSVKLHSLLTLDHNKKDDIVTENSLSPQRSWGERSKQ